MQLRPLTWGAWKTVFVLLLPTSHMGRDVGRIWGRGNGFGYVLLVFWHVLARLGAFRGRAPKQTRKLVLAKRGRNNVPKYFASEHVPVPKQFC